MLITLARRVAVTAIAAMLVGSPAAAPAQEVPSYAQSTVVSTDETIHGRIHSVQGAFTIAVDDDRGFIDNVQLHAGTIINPTGLALNPGMSVTILGVNAGSVFDANEIDTPYSYDGGLPAPVYYGSGYWCPGFAYGYGPAFSLVLVIGGGHRFEHRPFSARPWDGRRYFGAYVSEGVGGGNRYLLSRGGHVPGAFVGRSFAGRSSSGGGYASGYSGGERRFAGANSTSVRANPPFAAVENRQRRFEETTRGFAPGSLTSRVNAAPIAHFAPRAGFAGHSGFAGHDGGFRNAAGVSAARRTHA